MSGKVENPPAFKNLLGKTLKAVEGCKKGCDTIDFITTDGERFRLYHSQDCCESVSIEDVCGDPTDLVGEPILQAEESTSGQDPDGYKREYPPESCTWTFYRIATIKGQVVIRWLGESNGYYSESVDFVKLET